MNCIRVATVAETFGRVSMLVFDGTERKRFFDKSSTDLFPIVWCERTGCPLSTPYGRGKSDTGCPLCTPYGRGVYFVHLIFKLSADMH